MNISDAQYKKEQSEFVGNQKGTTLTEVSIIFLGIAASIYIRKLVHILYKPTNKWLIFCLDFLFLVLPGQLSVTLLSDYVSQVLLLMMMFSLLLMVVIPSAGTSNMSIVTKDWQHYLQREYNSKLPCISHFRAFTLICTAICILAVDFKVFPRRFCKADPYGTGVMDTGVGLFIVANAIVSPEARGKMELNNLGSLLQSVKSATPLLLLGIGRTVSTAGADYYVSVTEYGAHWNFFITLAAVKIITSFLYYFCGNIPWNGPAVAMIAVYQGFLTKGGLGDYITLGLDGNGGRSGLLDANREGICSCTGYVCLYFFGVEIGKVIFTKGRNKTQDWIKFTLWLLVFQALLWLLLQWTVSHVEPVSRKLANMSYVIWMLALSMQLLSSLLIVDLFVDFIDFRIKDKESLEMKDPQQEEMYLLQAINYNSLFYFLLANILTGLVNLSIRTLYIPTVQSFIIISMYKIILNTVAFIFYQYNIKIKFW